MMKMSVEKGREDSFLRVLGRRIEPVWLIGET